MPSPGETATENVCVKTEGSECNSTWEVDVHNCGAFYIYYLTPTLQCNQAYCVGKLTLEPLGVKVLLDPLYIFILMF